MGISGIINDILEFHLEGVFRCESKSQGETKSLNTRIQNFKINRGP